MYGIFCDLGIEQNILHTWYNEINNDFVKFNFHSIKLNDVASTGGNIMIDSCSVLEVMKGVAQTTSELNKN